MSEKTIAHNLVQGGPGFPYLCLTLYWYIATGDLQQRLSKPSCIDILDPVLAEYVRKVIVMHSYLEAKYYAPYFAVFLL